MSQVARETGLPLTTTAAPHATLLAAHALAPRYTLLSVRVLYPPDDTHLTELPGASFYLSRPLFWEEGKGVPGMASRASHRLDPNLTDFYTPYDYLPQGTISTFKSSVFL